MIKNDEIVLKSIYESNLQIFYSYKIQFIFIIFSKFYLTRLNENSSLNK